MICEKSTALLHSYGYHPEDVTRPDERGTLQVCAGGELYLAGSIERIVITADHQNHSRPSQAEIMLLELQRLFPQIPVQDIITNPVAKSTRGEVFTLWEMAKQED